MSPVLTAPVRLSVPGPSLRRATLAALSVLGVGLGGCGPTLVNFDPNNAVSIDVRPVEGQKVFCPGATFQVEVLAKLQSGSQCSSTDRNVGCQGQKDAVINPTMIRLEGSTGKRTGDLEKFMWSPPADIFETADTGLVLRAWLEKQVEGQYQKSPVGESELVPVYQCRMGDSFSASSGAPGPDISIAVTSLKTPYYADAALIRVDAQGSRLYYISPSPEQPVHITTYGGDGPAGAQGKAGEKGEDGRAAPSGSPACTRGEAGRDGQDGGPGGPGGDGGPGGNILIQVDKSAGSSLLSRIVAESRGGGPGAAGRGGDGGPGGRGGDGVTGPNCSDVKGQDGRAGRAGQSGQAGRPGQSGPAPTVKMAARQSLFVDEMTTIQRIESAKRKVAH